MNYVFLKGSSNTFFTKNWVKAIYFNSSGESFLPLKLPIRKIYKNSLAYKKNQARKKSYLPD